MEPRGKRCPLGFHEASIHLRYFSGENHGGWDCYRFMWNRTFFQMTHLFSFISFKQNVHGCSTVVGVVWGPLKGNFHWLIRLETRHLNSPGPMVCFEWTTHQTMLSPLNFFVHPSEVNPSAYYQPISLEILQTFCGAPYNTRHFSIPEHPVSIRSAGEVSRPWLAWIRHL